MTDIATSADRRRRFGLSLPLIFGLAVYLPLLFAARAMRLIREIAQIYGQRPGLAGTVHLLRRLVGGAGLVGAVDLVGGVLVQQLSGAVVERLSAAAAESAYAAQKMARLGIVAMVLCRPAEFRPGEIPSLRSLVSGLLKPGADKAGLP